MATDDLRDQPMADKAEISPEWDAWIGIIEDSFDAALILGGLLYVFLRHDLGITLSQPTVGAAASAGAGLRLVLRKILMRIAKLKSKKAKVS